MKTNQAMGEPLLRWGLEPRTGTYQNGIDWMKSWLSQRMDFIDQQLVQPPQFSQEGGRFDHSFQLAITGQTNATLYYTLDGSDPRLAQGEISSNAMVYTDPIVLHGDVRIVARARTPDQRQTGGPPDEPG